MKGSASLSRGGVSCSTADKVALFLVELACELKAALPFTDEGQGMLDLTKLDSPDASNDEKVSTSLKIATGSAFGSMLSVEGSTPLMKQRLVHVTMKYIRSTYDELCVQSNNGEAVTAPRVGLLMIACHIVCCSNLQRLDKNAVRQLSTIIILGMSSWIFSAIDERNKPKPEVTAVKKMVLASTLKLICIVPTEVLFFSLTLLHCCANYAHLFSLLCCPRWRES